MYDYTLSIEPTEDNHFIVNFYIEDEGSSKYIALNEKELFKIISKLIKEYNENNG